MVQKRKTVSKLAAAAQVASKDNMEVEEEQDLQIVAVEKEATDVSEKELVVQRTKELKAMSADDLKQLLSSNGLETGKKEVMISAFLKFEAKARAAVKAQKSRIRAVVVAKKQELEGLPTAQLNKLCETAGMKGLRSKEERVQRLLVQWQENEGVDKALAQIAQAERKQELDALDDAKLQKLCNKVGVDPFVKEIMVDRISKHENDAGCYARPAMIQETEAPASKAAPKVDMVDALLANEAQRKKEMDAKLQQEEAVAQKMKELKSLSIDDLKKKLVKKGLEANGKKEDMLKAMFLVGVQEDALAKRKSELGSKSQQDLKELLSRNGLETGSKEQMIKTVLAHEDKCRKDLVAFDAKVDEVMVQKKVQLEKNGNAELKEMCAAKGLAVGGGKEEKVERLVEEMKVSQQGELDKSVSRTIREKRKEELMSMDKAAVLKICQEKEIDPAVRGIMVERIMSRESDGDVAMAMMDEAPAAKRARK